MKRVLVLLMPVLISTALAAQNNGKQNAFDKANNVANKVSNIIAVFQPYLLKARLIFYDAKQLAGEVKNSAKSTFGKNGNTTNNGLNGGAVPTQGQPGYVDNSNNSSTTQNQGTYNNANNTNSANNGNNNYQNQSNTNGNGYTSNNNNNGYGQNVQSYLPNQSLPVNNPASINNDGTGNWGNQNNGLYGNCLDVMTGSVMGMGDAAQSPASVDLMFFAPADGQSTYVLMTPGFAKNNTTATYMTEHTSEQVMQWTDVNESEVALTKLSIGQFNQIQNNGQIKSASLNAQDYAGYYAGVAQKLDGKVFAVKVQMDNRETYALIAIFKQFGTSGSNGYLKIAIKTTGLSNNVNNQPNANAYIR